MCAFAPNNINLFAYHRKPDGPFPTRRSGHSPEARRLAEGTLSVHDALRSSSIRTVMTTKITGANKLLLHEIMDDQGSRFLSTRFIL